MKNLFVLFALVLTNFAFGQSVTVDTFQYYTPFIQGNDTLILTGIQPNEVSFELAEYASNVAVKTEMVLVNKDDFGDEMQIFLYKIGIAEAIEEQSKIVSKLDRFREKNVQIGGKTPIIERTVVLTVKKNTVIVYEN
jgi:hypothetical protein